MEQVLLSNGNTLQIGKVYTVSNTITKISFAGKFTRIGDGVLAFEMKYGKHNLQKIIPIVLESDYVFVDLTKD